MHEYILTFTGVFVINIAYTYYVKAVQANKPINAGIWAMLLNGISNSLVLGYVSNHMLIIPACLGAFTGTLAGMQIGNKNERKIRDTQR
jgi:hypothetical protein